jgi:superfamily II DNA or RNA helicase
LSDKGEAIAVGAVDFVTNPQSAIQNPQSTDPPAILLRLPPPFVIGTARREEVREAVAPAARLPALDAPFTLGTPVSQYGTAKLWRARSVDLRGLLFGSFRAYAPPRPEEGAAPRRQRPDAGESAYREWQDELARRLAAVLQPPPETLLRATGPLEWPGSFFPYQRDGIQALVQSPRLLLGDEMGLGKTVMAIAALRLLLVRREIERALVVTPASLLEQWRRELLLWAPELRVMLVHGAPEDRAWRWQYRTHVTLTSYETLRVDYTGSPICGPCRERWGAVVLDEAQKIKNRDSEVSQACKGLPRERSWALTGTPLENRPEDVLSILEFVTGGEGEAPLVATGPALRAALGRYQLRRRKTDVLRDLPPKIVTDLLLPLTRAQRRDYERAEREGIVALRERGEVRLENVLALITRLKQICNFAPSVDASAKMDDLEERLDELTAAGHKALVFTQYTGDDSGARHIAARLGRFSPLLFTGDMGLRERARAVEQFQTEDDHPVMVLSLKAGGQGLNLQRAAYVFHFDRWWNPAAERQAEDRSHRLGQTQPVNVYRYVMADTIEERIDALLKSKTELFEQIVEESSLDLAPLLDQRDLFGLVGLAPLAPAADPSGATLEARTAALLARQGYRVEKRGGKGDGGVDIIAEKQDAVGTRVRLLVQCKDSQRPVGVEVARSLHGALPPGDRGVIGILVCPSGFTAEARAFAAARHVQLWDAAKLERLEQDGQLEEAPGD